MRFALVGNHPDGVEMACAMVASGRHQMLAYTTAVKDEVLKRWGEEVRQAHDLEQVLADPAIEVVLVAGHLNYRALQLRRVLQSERHVLCVHPADRTPDGAYEASMIRDDTGYVLLPLLSLTFHPAIQRLREFVSQRGSPDRRLSAVGEFQLLKGELLGASEGPQPEENVRVVGWEILRAVGGEILEVSGFAEEEEANPQSPLLLAGRFEHGGLFQWCVLPCRTSTPDTGQTQDGAWRFTLVGQQGTVELTFPVGERGPALLDWIDAEGERREEYWDPWDPWMPLLDHFEQSLASGATQPAKGPGQGLTWQDAIRCLELDDAVRRSVARRRSSLLDYPDATEETTFKGTMTLVGCGLLWSILVLLILSVWLPRVGWLTVPILVVFLVLQLLRYAIPSSSSDDKGPQDK